MDADVAERRDRRDDQHGRQVHECAGSHHLEVARTLGEGRVGERGGQHDAELVEEAHHVSGPADRDRGRGEQVLEDQVPADEPRDELAERGVRVGVRAARDGNHRRELGVAEAREGATESRDQERDDQRGAGVVRGRGAGEHENAGADDRPDAEQHQRAGVERALQLVRLVALVQLADRLRGEQALRHRLNPPATRPARTGAGTRPWLRRPWACRRSRCRPAGTRPR